MNFDNLPSPAGYVRVHFFKNHRRLGFRLLYDAPILDLSNRRFFGEVSTIGNHKENGHTEHIQKTTIKQ